MSSSTSPSVTTTTTKTASGSNSTIVALTGTTTSIIRDPTKGIKVNADIFAKPYRDEIQRKVQILKSSGREPPLLVGILANNDPAAKQYAEWTGKACQNDGLRYELRTIDDPLNVEEQLQIANDDPTVHGIIVYYPIFGISSSSSSSSADEEQVQTTFSGTNQDDYIRDSISYKCDVEGLCHLYRTNLYKNTRYLDSPTNTQKCLLPCTSLAVVKILESCPGLYIDSSIDNNNNTTTTTTTTTKPIKHLQGKVITIINRSEIVGRPLAAMLANDGAIVYSIDINSIYKIENKTSIKNCTNTISIEQCIKQSNVIISGVPTKNYKLNCTWIQNNTIVVNVSSYKNVNEDILLQIPGIIYIPQVGKVTVAMLERNLMRLYEQFHHIHDTNVAYTISSSAVVANQQQQQLQQQNQQRSIKPSESNLQQQQQQLVPWYGHPLNLYTAFLVTAIFAIQIMKK